MGCSSAKVIDDKKESEADSILNIPNNKRDKYHIRRKGGHGYDDSVSILDEHEQLKEIAKEEIEILNQFNSKYNNDEGITLASLSQYYLHSNKENTNIISLSSNEKIIKCLKNINPFNENIDDNKDINLLKSQLVKIETKHPKLIKPVSPLFHLNLTQVIHQNYNFNFKLKNVITNEYKLFNFNSLDRPLLFIFFDILSFEAVNKIKEFRQYEKEVNNDENKNFLLIPIMNVFVQEDESLDEQKKYLESINIKKECYILTQPTNSSFIKLFELDCVTQSKCIIINRNSEISLILEDHIEYLTQEMIDFYLNTRNSEYKNDYFKNENKDELKNVLQKNEYKNILENFTQKFNLEIEFKEIETKKYPVNIRFMYHQKDTKNAQNILNKLKSFIKSKIKKYFIGEYVIQDKKESLLKAMDYLKEKINEINSNSNDNNNLNNFIESNINASNSSFILFNQTSSIYNNNDITKNKKYILKYYLNDLAFFNQTLEILSSNLYNNPQFSQLGCGHSIIPKKGLKLNTIIKECREVKLFTDKKSQLKYQSSNEDINFNLEENKTEVIILLNPNVFINNNEQKEKIKNIFEVLSNNKINFIICVFSYNELDAQKLRYLSWDKIYSSNLKKKSKKDKTKKEKKDIGLIDEPKNFKIIYLNSILPQNYLALGYYSEDITFKMIHLSNKCEIINFYDLDNFDLSDLSLDNLSNKNIFDYLDYISHKSHFDNNLNSTYFNNYEKNIKSFKNNKKEILSNILDNKYLSKWKNYKCTNLNFSLSYEKNLLFEDDNKFNNYKAKYQKVQVNISYFDFIKQHLKIDKINSIIEDNNKNSSIKFTLNATELKTINLFPKITKTYICSKCLKEKVFNNDSFYMCNFCRITDYLLCRDCYDDLYYSSKDKKEDDDFFKDFIMQDPSQKNPEDEKEEKLYEKIHEHPLLFLFNFDTKKNTYILSDLYNKYIEILTSKSKKKMSKSDIKVCFVCSNYLFEDSKNINVILSHIKTKSDFSQYDKPYDELFICNECFETNEYQNIILKEETDNNFVILKLLTD